MLQGQPLAIGQEPHGVVPHDVATADGVDPDLVVGPCAHRPLATVDTTGVVPAGLQGIHQRQGRARGGVALPTMVGLDDLEVRFREGRGGTGHQVEEEGDAGGEVGGLKQRRPRRVT